MKTSLATTLALGAVLMLSANQSTNAALTQPVESAQKQAQTTPAGWAYYHPAPAYYYYEPAPEYYAPEYYYYQPVVPYYYPDPYFVSPGLSFNINL